ncbi:MAG: cation-transporting P-type ATPase [Caldilineaceae bacterium]
MNNIPIETYPIHGVYAALASRPAGLNETETAERLRQYGPNRISEAPTQPLWRKLLANFTHLMALLLWIGGLVALAAGMPELAVAIWLVNLINGVFSFWQEYKAEQATAALRRMLPTFAHVLRRWRSPRAGRRADAGRSAAAGRRRPDLGGRPAGAGGGAICRSVYADR